MTDLHLKLTLEHALLMSTDPHIPPIQRDLWAGIAANLTEYLAEPETEFDLFGDQT